MSGIRVNKKADGYLIVADDGSARYMTFWESMVYRFFCIKPKFSTTIGKP